VETVTALVAAALAAAAGAAFFFLGRRASPGAERTRRLAAVGELAAALAHDIKSPLAGISGAAQVLAEDFPEGDPRAEVVREMIDKIDGMDRAVKDLLRYARPAGLKLSVEAVGQVLEESAAAVSEMARSRGVVIRVEPSGGQRVAMDAEQVRYALGAVMASALWSMPEGGVLTARALERADGAVVEVSALGRALSPEEMKELFRPVFKAGLAGSGLGMAIAKNTAERHGGSLVVESPRGGGTRYRLTLPCRP